MNITTSAHDHTDINFSEECNGIHDFCFISNGEVTNWKVILVLSLTVCGIRCSVSAEIGGMCCPLMHFINYSNMNMYGVHYQLAAKNLYWRYCFSCAYLILSKLEEEIGGVSTRGEKEDEGEATI